MTVNAGGRAASTSSSRVTLAQSHPAAVHQYVHLEQANRFGRDVRAGEPHTGIAPNAESDQHVIVMTPTTPPMTIVQNPAEPVGDQGQRCDTSGALLANAPDPCRFRGASRDQNNLLPAVAADGRTLIQGEPFALCSAGRPGTVEYFDTRRWTATSTGMGCVGWDGGSDVSALGGAIRLGEFVPGGVVDHALQIDVDAPNLYHGSATTCFVPPASQCDGYGPSDTGGPTGTWDGLAPGASALLDLSSLGLDAPGMILAEAFQDYGAYIANDADRSVNNIVTEHGPSGSVADVYDAGGNLVTNRRVPDGLGRAIRHRRRNGTTPGHTTSRPSSPTWRS